MLQTSDLSFAYPGGSEIRFPDIVCQSGEQWLILGQSGSGKTTLLHLLAGLRTAQSGTIQIGKTQIENLPAAELDVFRGRNIGIIFQTSHFIRSLSVEENLLLTQELAELEPDKKRIHHLLDRLRIGHKLKSKTSDLSVGEQQRVAIARALVNQPKLILADEPTSALDDLNAEEVLTLLKEQAEAVNASLLIVTHDNRLKEAFDKKIEL